MIMLNIFIKVKKEKEVGSSTMPQKVNPINFENAEGNLGLSNSILEDFVRKLTSSRLQRDLSDSTVRRNFGEALGYAVLGWQSIMNGLDKIQANGEYLKRELENHWEILGEAIQTALRLKKDQKGYEKVKQMTRGKVMDQSLYNEVIKALGLEDNPDIKNLTPAKYVGYAESLVDKLKI
jgi:adenylosuccinate lyase